LTTFSSANMAIADDLELAALGNRVRATSEFDGK
jgi:hypothetical protein